MLDIFNLSSDEFIAQSAKKVRVSDENIYDPDVTKAPNGVYKAVLRFIPWFGAKSVDEIRYKKYTVKLTNPLTNEKFFIDDPSTVGSSSVFWNLESRLKKLEKEEPELHKQLIANFSRFYKYFSLVYIKKDPQNPHLEGQIKVFPYGFKIWKLGEDLINPQDAELGTAVKCNPFDMVNGRDFIFVAKKKNQQWRDFDSCKFVPENSALIVKAPNGNEVSCTADIETQKKFRAFLEKNSPDLSNYFFKEWKDADYFRAVDFLKAAIPAKSILDEAFAQCRDQKIKDAYANSAKAVAQKSAKTPQASSLDDLESDLTFGGSPAMAASVPTGSVSDLEFDAPSTTVSAKPAASIDDDMFADL
jgi:hypothetical protein